MSDSRRGHQSCAFAFDLCPLGDGLDVIRSVGHALAVFPLDTSGDSDRAQISFDTSQVRCGGTSRVGYLVVDTISLQKSFDEFYALRWYLPWTQQCGGTFQKTVERSRSPCGP